MAPLLGQNSGMLRRYASLTSASSPAGALSLSLVRLSPASLLRHYRHAHGGDIPDDALAWADGVRCPDCSQPHLRRGLLVLAGLPRRPRRTQWALTSHRRGRQRPRRPLQPHRPPRRHPLPRSRLQPPHMQTPAHKFPSARTPPLVMAAGVAMRLIPAPLVAFAPASCGLVQWPRRCCLRMVASRPSFAGCGAHLPMVMTPANPTPLARARGSYPRRSRLSMVTPTACSPPATPTHPRLAPCPALSWSGL